MGKLVRELNKLGWGAFVWINTRGERTVAVAEAASLHSPVLRRGRYVWEGHHAVKPSTMAARLDTFLRERGIEPLRPELRPGAKVLVKRGGGGPKGKPGCAREVRGTVVERTARHEVAVKLAQDDKLDTVGWKRKGDVGRWSVSAVRLETP